MWWRGWPPSVWPCHPSGNRNKSESVPHSISREGGEWRTSQSESVQDVMVRLSVPRTALTLLKPIPPQSLIPPIKPLLIRKCLVELEGALELKSVARQVLWLAPE